MEEDRKDQINMKISDRVRRKDKEGCCGVIKDIRDEITGTASEPPEKSLMIKVLWDNGTASYLSPEALEHA